MKIINILNEEIMLSKWVNPVTSIILDTISNSLVDPLNSVLYQKSIGKNTSQVTGKIVSHTINNLSLALTAVGKKIAPLNAIKSIDNPDNKNAGTAEWFTNKITIQFQQMTKVVQGIIQNILQTASSQVNKNQIKSALSSNDVIPVIREFVDTFLHELFHITQFTNGADRKNGPHQGSYRDNPKVPNEHRRLEAEYELGGQIDVNRLNALYLASPREIGAWANGVALKIIHKYHLEPGSGDVDITALDQDIHREIDQIVTVSQRYKPAPTKTERKIYRKYTKQVYKELIDYLRSEEPDVSDVNATQHSTMYNLIEKEYPNFSDQTKDIALFKFKQKLNITNAAASPEYAKIKLRSIALDPYDSSYRDEKTDAFVNAMLAYPKFKDYYTNTIINKNETPWDRHIRMNSNNESWVLTRVFEKLPMKEFYQISDGKAAEAFANKLVTTALATLPEDVKEIMQIPDNIVGPEKDLYDYVVSTLTAQIKHYMFEIADTAIFTKS